MAKAVLGLSEREQRLALDAMKVLLDGDQPRVVAVGFRTAGLRPPAALYHFGDAVTAGVIGLSERSRHAAVGLGRIAKVNTLVVLLLVFGWFWVWNEHHCPPTKMAGACVRPAAARMQAVTGK